MSKLGFGRLASWLSVRPPTVGIEIAPRRVTAVAIAGRGHTPAVSKHATERLPPGVVVPVLTAPNIADPATVGRAVTRALGRLGVRHRRVALVVPDSMAKVSLVRFEKVPTRGDDLDQLIRWQMRKAAPFRIEDAQVAYTEAARLPQGGREFVVTLARREILEEYERACAAAGAHAGIVDLSTFSLINVVLAAGPQVAADGGQTGDWMLVHVTPEYSTIAIVRDTALVFFRNRRAEADGNLADLVHQTTMYYEDRLAGLGFSRVLLAGAAVSGDTLSIEDAEQLRVTLQQRVGCRVETVDPREAAAVRGPATSAAELDALASPVGLLLREGAA